MEKTAKLQFHYTYTRIYPLGLVNCIVARLSDPAPTASSNGQSLAIPYSAFNQIKRKSYVYWSVARMLLPNVLQRFSTCGDACRPKSTIKTKRNQIEATSDLSLGHQKSKKKKSCIFCWCCAVTTAVASDTRHSRIIDSIDSFLFLFHFCFLLCTKRFGPQKCVSLLLLLLWTSLGLIDFFDFNK